MIFDIIGVSGTVLILFAYFLLQAGKLKSGTILFNSLNFFGALGIIISLTQDWNLPAFFIEVCWAAIALYGIARAIRKGIARAIRKNKAPK